MLKIANAKPGAAHPYVYREFHTGLLSGGYTAFCVAPEQHTHTLQRLRFRRVFCFLRSFP